MREIESMEALKSLIGEEVAVTDWVEISQQRIQQFADATDDQQWIHTDPQRAKEESPYKTTVAHGFLTLSLLPMLMQRAVHLKNVRMALNYGLNKVRFPAPVPVGSRLRARMRLDQVEDIPGGAQIIWTVTIEREGGDKPVCVAESITRRYS